MFLAPLLRVDIMVYLCITMKRAVSLTLESLPVPGAHADVIRMFVVMAPRVWADGSPGMLPVENAQNVIEWFCA